MITLIIIPSAFNTSVLQQISHSPVSEEFVSRVWFSSGGIDKGELIHHFFNSYKSVLIMLYQGFGCIFAETVEEINHEEVARAVVRTVIPDVSTPVIELHVGIVHVRPVKAACVIIIHMFSQH